MSELTTADILRLHGLHWVTRVALRIRSPLQAKDLVDRIARRFPPLRGVESARDAVRTLSPSGSCLSRAMTIAAALPGSEVVIGVDAWSAARIAAHAWLEIEGACVDTNPRGAPLPDVLARLPSRPSNGLLPGVTKPNLSCHDFTIITSEKEL
jgi:hypothetical protein